MWLKKRNSECSSRGTLKCSSPAKNGTIRGKISRRLCSMCTELAAYSEFRTTTAASSETSRHWSGILQPAMTKLNKWSGLLSEVMQFSNTQEMAHWWHSQLFLISLSHWLRSCRECICLQGFSIIHVYLMPGHVALMILFSTGTFLDGSKNCHYLYYCWSCAPWEFIKESSKHVLNVGQSNTEQAWEHDKQYNG